ncbi:hypothetical protein Tco_0603166 [Tanacetum coccineum]
MKRGYVEDIVPLQPAMLAGAAVDQAPLPEGNTSGSAEDSMQLKELIVLVPTLVTKINSLEKELKDTKQTLGNVVLKLVKKVKYLETALKRKSKKNPRKKKSTELLLQQRFRGGTRREISPTILRQLKLDKEDWDAIKSKLEANAELTKDVLGKDLPEQDFAKRMAEMVGKLVQQIDTFISINLEATKAKLKRYGEELQTKTSKKQRFDDKDVPAIEDKVVEVKEEEPVKRTGKRKKQKARKGINVDKSAQEDSETDKDESVEAMNPTPLTTKSDSVVNWKIFQQGQRSIYQIMRANRADTVYMSFGAMVKDFTREDLIELYRLVMQKYGTNRPEDAYDRVLWSDLRTMFDPPLNEDAIWSLPLQQKMVINEPLFSTMQTLTIHANSSSCEEKTKTKGQSIIWFSRTSTKSIIQEEAKDLKTCLITILKIPTERQSEET